MIKRYDLKPNIQIKRCGFTPGSKQAARYSLSKKARVSISAQNGKYQYAIHKVVMKPCLIELNSAFY